MTKEKHDLFKIKNIFLPFRIFINDVGLSNGIQLKNKRHSAFRLPSLSIHVVWLYRYTWLVSMNQGVLKKSSKENWTLADW